MPLSIGLSYWSIRSTWTMPPAEWSSVKSGLILVGGIFLYIVALVSMFA